MQEISHVVLKPYNLTNFSPKFHQALLTVQYLLLDTFEASFLFHHFFSLTRTPLLPAPAHFTQSDLLRDNYTAQVYPPMPSNGKCATQGISSSIGLWSWSTIRPLNNHTFGEMSIMHKVHPPHLQHYSIVLPC